jgi:hypothetical protein
MKNLRKFLDFIKEELRIDKMDPENIEQIKRCLCGKSFPIVQDQTNFSFIVPMEGDAGFLG